MPSMMIEEAPEIRIDLAQYHCSWSERSQMDFGIDARLARYRHQAFAKDHFLLQVEG